MFRKMGQLGTDLPSDEKVEREPLDKKKFEGALDEIGEAADEVWSENETEKADGDES